MMTMLEHVALAAREALGQDVIGEIELCTGEGGLRPKRGYRSITNAICGR
jgi:hypothetical protein